MTVPLDLEGALAYSHYATRMLGAHPADRDWLRATLDAPLPRTRRTAHDWPGKRATAEALATALRTLRRRTLLHTLARDLTGRAGLEEVCRNMTSLAEVSLDAALTFHHAALAAVHGEPRNPEGAAQQLVVIGMGKLGGGELNVSSDVDLVFVYPDEGETDGARPSPNREFFDRLARRVIGALDDVTADGFVFRVDMRLRPYGESGPPTVSFAALEQYLITQGRAWERYAWLKARPLTGARHDELAALVTPFVFRKYLDFDAYEGLRDVHRQIREQVKRRDYAPDIKLGPGGIREIEFIVQALQIVRGGREPALRVRGTQAALDAIAVRGLIPAAAIATLRDAYVFLRGDRAPAAVPRRPADAAPSRRAKKSARPWREPRASGTPLELRTVARRAPGRRQCSIRRGLRRRRGARDRSSRLPVAPSLAALWRERRAARRRTARRSPVRVSTIPRA